MVAIKQKALKKKKKIHQIKFYKSPNKLLIVKYVCNEAVLPSIDKITMDKNKVTCKNCLKLGLKKYAKRQMDKFA